MTNTNALRRSTAPSNPWPMTLVPTSMESAWTLAKSAAAAGFYRLTPDQSLMIVLEGNLLGIHPVAALRGFHVIEGRPSPSAGLVASLVRHCPYMRYRVLERTVQRCVLEWLEKIDGKWEQVGFSDFTLEDAARMGKGEIVQGGRFVAKKSDSNWAKSPADMNFARAMTRGVRTYCPELTHGPLYLEDELRDEVDGPAQAVEIQATTKTNPAGPAQAVEAELVEDDRDVKPEEVDEVDQEHPDGASIREEREAKGYTMAELGRAASLPARTVSAVERGVHKDPTAYRACHAALRGLPPKGLEPDPEPEIDPEDLAAGAGEPEGVEADEAQACDEEELDPAVKASMDAVWAEQVKRLSEDDAEELAERLNRCGCAGDLAEIRSWIAGLSPAAPAAPAPVPPKPKKRPGWKNAQEELEGMEALREHVTSLASLLPAEERARVEADLARAQDAARLHAIRAAVEAALQQRRGGTAPTPPATGGVRLPEDLESDGAGGAS